MKEQSKKDLLISAMIESDRVWSYREMQKFVFKLSYPNAEFTKSERGYWSTNFCASQRGYMLSGGNGRVFKVDGGWRARWHTGNENDIDRLMREVKILCRVAHIHGRNDRSFSRISTEMLPKLEKKIRKKFQK